MLKDEEILDIARRIAAEQQGDAVEEVNVRSGTDHDGDPIVVVSVRFRPGVDVPSSALLPLHFAISEAMQARGDLRFAHVRLSFADGGQETPPARAVGRRRSR